MKCKDSSLASVLGSSNGKHNQSLSYNLILESIWVLEPSAAVDRKKEDVTKAVRGKVWVRWNQVSNFSESDEKSRHHVLDTASGLVRFGDGTHGRIPPRGATIKATYRTSESIDRPRAGRLFHC